MNQINSSQVIDSPEILINPALSAPKGLRGWKFGIAYDDEGNVVYPDYSDMDDTEDLSSTDTAEDGKLTAPTNLNITSQTISFDANGNHVVSVVIEFDEVDGAVKYESRVSK